MRRKPLFGCLGAIGLVTVAALIFLYVNVLRPMNEIMGDLKQLGRLSDMNEQVVAQGPFEAPADGALSADQLERFAGVQASMRAALGADYDELRRLLTLIGERVKVRASS